MTSSSCRVLCAIALLSNACVSLAADGGAGCTGCHGPNGVSSSGGTPTIAGMSAAYLNSQMTAYQGGTRTCVPASASDMCSIAKSTSAADVGSTSAFFASQHFVAARQQTDPAVVRRGRAIHQLRCEACHSHSGGDTSDDAGLLAGQWRPYLEVALTAMVAHTRPQPPAMQSQVEHLSAADVTALSEFYASEVAP